MTVRETMTKWNNQINERMINMGWSKVFIEKGMTLNQALSMICDPEELEKRIVGAMVDSMIQLTKADQEKFIADSDRVTIESATEFAEDLMKAEDRGKQYPFPVIKYQIVDAILTFHVKVMTAVKKELGL